MIDPAVERQFSDTKELLALWNTFHQFFTLGIKGENINPEKENQFLEVKSRIAMLHDSFMEALTTNQNIGQEVLNIITRAITLKHLGKLSTADTKKMEIEWHESYLLLNDTIAALEQKRRDLAEINETQYKAGIAAAGAKQKVGKFLGSFYFKLAAIIVVLLGATIGVQVMGFYDYDDLGKIKAIQTPYSWGKAVVRSVHNPDSPWPDVNLVRRRNYSGWPEGIKEPAIDNGVTKDDAARQISGLATGIGLQPAVFAPALQKATDYRKEEAEKSGQANLQIHTFLFGNADDAKAVEKMWEDGKSAANQRGGEIPKVVRQMDLIRDVNIITFIFSENEETMRRMVTDVYNKKA